MGTFFSWLFGLVWLVSGAGGIIAENWLGGALLVAIGLSMLPRVHQRINDFLERRARSPLARFFTTGHGSWAVAGSLLALLSMGLLSPGTSLGDVAGGSILAGLAFFVFRTIRDKIDRFVARAMGSPLEEPPPAPEETLEERPIETEIRTRLEALKDHDSVRQLRQLRRKFDAFEQMLEKRFEQSELTYGRYRQVVEDSFLGCVDNLGKIAEAWTGIAAVDVEAVNRQLAHATDDTVRQALQQRLALVQQSHDHIATLRAANEMAMTRLDEITVQLSRIQTRRGHSSVELQDSLKELSSLAHGTQMYDMKR